MIGRANEDFVPKDKPGASLRDASGEASRVRSVWSPGRFYVDWDSIVQGCQNLISVPTREAITLMDLTDGSLVKVRHITSH